ncbi:RpiB/LacA/LacB family sugar-phosphate isomerase [Bacillus sp. HMF5848]|uniref:RpiB/LacA/LacB family sugar-phosphate isomerase n=1 Tax=Bacillus sp. HMF5848 TaxID=2495421 RepID=UPI000F79003F|nr:RpiB/LacA/LacB family sugar-phosphate isomerase [Bacillus sp. HMF5848]RSK25722.1 RpiB/LacA/LacB family sugar-phosphate isomerase [Bacillus sp. HMF5848]
MKKVLIGSDKSGFFLKEFVKSDLVAKGYDVTDCGTLDPNAPMPFYEVAPIAAKKIQDQEFEKAILCCGTGMGMAIVSNKFEGVHAAVVESVYAAEKCRAINDANVLTMGGWIVAETLGAEIANKFLETEFTQGLEEWRQVFLKKARDEVKEIEQASFRSSTPS